MIGLLGGSFDPIHHGHLIVARVLQETLALDAVRLLPAREQPFKLGRHAAAPEHRARMVELAVAGAPGLSLERCELDRAGPSYTVDTLRFLRSREPGSRFILLVGADAARELPQWREATALPGLAEVVTFARAGLEAPRQPGVVSRVVEVPALAISATEIRRRVRDGLPIRYWVPEPVAEYIAAHGLYRSEDA